MTKAESQIGDSTLNEREERERVEAVKRMLATPPESHADALKRFKAKDKSRT